jgi:hypothetical protein
MLPNIIFNDILYVLKIYHVLGSRLSPAERLMGGYDLLACACVCASFVFEMREKET